MAGFEPSKWLRVIQTSPFLRKWSSLGLTDNDLLLLEQKILKGPERCPMIKGTNGLRKIRFVPQGQGRGKSGAYRACFAYFARRGMVFLLTAYGKNERADLNAADRHAMAAIIRDIERAIEEGSIR
jgi:hypothetical protein